MPLYSPPVPRNGKKQKFQHVIRRLTWRHKKSGLDGSCKHRRVWKRKKPYYYVHLPKKHHCGKILTKIRPKQEDLQIQFYKMINLMRSRPPSEIDYKKPFVLVSRRQSPWRFILRRKQQYYYGHNKTFKKHWFKGIGKSRGILSLACFLAMECGRFVSTTMSDKPDKNMADNLTRLSKLLKTLERILRHARITRLLPWKRRSKKKMVLSLEW